jgi:hypothetical protein
MPRVPLLLLLAACGGDHALVPEVVPELCNGADDDADGLVDENFLDLDLNGRADCVDATCWDLATAEAGAIPYDPCLRPTVADPWAVDELWAYAGPMPIMRAYYSTVAVGYLVDGDEDGVYGSAGDAPTVVLAGYANYGIDPGDNYLIALDGRTGAPLWEKPDVAGVAHALVIADVDGDGVPDLIGADADGFLTTWDAAGARKRSSSSIAQPLDAAGTPIVTDLEPDGGPDVLFGDFVFDGVTLEPRFSLDTDTDTLLGHAAAVADVDDDGDKEIALAGRLFDSDGRLLWDSYAGGLATSAVFVQADGDREAEIAIVGSMYQLHDTDGTLLETASIDWMLTGPVCAADFDGDGEVELAWTNLWSTAVYELDGTERWADHTLNANEGIPTPMPPCAAADLNGDGAAELIVSTWWSTDVLDGPTGEVVFTAPRTGWADAPVVADVDRDGSVDLLGADVEYANGDFVWAISHRDRAWPAGPAIRPSFDYDGANLRADGAVPLRPALAWLENGGPRSIPPTPPARGADLRATLLEACNGEPGFGPVEVTVEIRNEGRLDAPAGARVALYADDGDGAFREVARAALPAVPALTALDTVRFALKPEDVGAVGWRVAVDVGEVVLECDESDNTDLLEHP